MRALAELYKEFSSRMMAVLRPIDIGMLKVCCIALGVIIGGLMPGLTKGHKKYIWFAVFGATLAPILGIVSKAILTTNRRG